MLWLFSIYSKKVNITKEITVLLTYFPLKPHVDKEGYTGSNNLGKILYGLPEEIFFCKRCVISNQRPVSSKEFLNSGRIPKKTINFDDDGICDACRASDAKSRIDWRSREEELRDLCDKYRTNDGSYDCLVPGSGGKDSFMQAHLLKYKYNMNPLTITWAPNIYTDWGRDNLYAWINAGFDNILFTPNGKVHRLLTRIAIERLFHPFQPFILGQKNLAPKIAAQYGISLIFYGENEAEYGNPLKDMSSAVRSWKFFSSKNEDNIVISGCTLTELRELGLSEKDWKLYLPCNPELLEKNDIQVHYLGYYEKWHPQGAYYYSIDNGNFKPAPERTCGTFSTYQSIDDKLDDFHYHTTYIKFGIGRATADAAQEIRSGDITREEGIALIKKYDGEYPKRWSEEVFNYLSIEKKDFPKIINAFEKPTFDKESYEVLSDNARSPHLWRWDKEKGWLLRKTIFMENNTINKDQEKSAKLWRGNQY